MHEENTQQVLSESKKSQNNYSKLLLILLLLIVACSIIAVFTFSLGKKREHKKTATKEIASTEPAVQNNNSSSITTTSSLSSDTGDYIWYIDDYIKFKYPKNSEVIVRSGHIIDEYTDFTGVYSVEIDNLISVSIVPGGGVATFSYDPSSNKVSVRGHAGEKTETSLGSNMFQYLCANDRYLLGFQKPDRDNAVTEYYSGQSPYAYFASKTSDEIYEGKIEFQPNESFSFIFGNGTVLGGSTDQGIYLNAQVLCPFDNKDQFDTCAKKIDTFLESVERLD